MDAARVAGALTRLGARIEQDAGKGLRLDRPIELLDVGKVARELDAADFDRLRHVEVVLEVDSTNARLLRMSRDGMPGPAACLAERQTAGRGRRGRTWVSPFGRNVCLSLLWPLDRSRGLEGLTIALGVAIASEVRGLGVPEAGLKWPNDVVVGGRKLGGILVEIANRAPGRADVVCGVGVNVGMSDEDAAAIEQPWCDLNLVAGGDVGRNHLAGRLLGAMMAALSRFDVEGFDAFAAEFPRFDVVAGRTVVVTDGEGGFVGVADGIDAHGALIVIAGEERRRVMSGEVSVRVGEARDARV